ncbi:MAG: hypothetical protein RL302_493 [Pseudomonadota bacterium]|jgi:uncharacterized protein (DUF697 family)
MTTRPAPAPLPVPTAGAEAIAQALLGLVVNVPTSSQTRARLSLPAAQSLTRAAARKAALTSGTLAMAPGPLGLLTLLPDLVAVWKIQAQMVSDIAAVYGKQGTLTQEHMLYCLFKHTASQAVRDLVVRAGERYLVKHATLAVLQQIARKLGIIVSKKVIGGGISRFLPVLGAMGVGGYAYYDTIQVAATAIELFEKRVVPLTGIEPVSST